MKKKRVIQIVAVGLFAVLLAFNVTTTINSTTDANVDVSLSGIEAMAQGDGEDEGGCTASKQCGVDPSDYVTCSAGAGGKCKITISGVKCTEEDGTVTTSEC